MRKLLLIAAVCLTACGRDPISDEASEPRDFGLSDPIDDAALMASLLDDANVFVRHAAAMKAEADAANRADLALLAGELRTHPAPNVPALLDRADALLSGERSALSALSAHLNAQSGDDRGLPELRTSLVKLLGNATYTGILEEAAKLLRADGASLSAGEVPRPFPRFNAVTVTKAAQIALALVGRDKRLEALPQIADRVDLLYPAKIPAATPPELIAASQLTAPGILHVPNAGYIFGGVLSAGRLRGIDCSAYLSVATSSSVRLSTGVMEFAWREMQGDTFAADDPDGAIRADMRAHYGLAEAEAEYAPVVAASLDDLRPGDLVVWRYPRRFPTADGHVAMFARRSVPGGKAAEFLGLEATRADDKSREGLLLRGFGLEPDDAFTFVLRRR